MLENLHSIEVQINQSIHDTQIHSEPIASLRERIRVGKKRRESNNGKIRLVDSKLLFL